MPQAPPPPLNPSLPTTDGATPAAVQTQPRRTLDEWLLARLDRYRWWLLPVGLLLFAAGFNGQWRITPDSAFHAALARDLYASADASRISDAPGLALWMAGALEVTGGQSFWPAILAMGLLGPATLGVIFLWVRSFAGRPTAIAVACLLACNVTFYRYFFYLLTDAPFVFGVALVLLGYEWADRPGRRRWLGWALLGAGLVVAAAFRSVAAVVLLGVELALLWRVVRGPRRLGAASLGLVIAGLALIGRLFDPRLDHPLQFNADEQRFLELTGTHLVWTLRQVVSPTHLPQMVADALPEATIGIELALPAGAILSAFVLVLVLRLFRHRVLWGVIPLLFIAQILLSRAALTRYLLPIVPLLTLAWWLGARWLAARLPRPWGSWCFAAMLVVWLGTNGVRIGDFILEQRAVPFAASYQEGRYTAIDAFRRSVAAEVGPEDMVFSEDDSHALTWFFERRIRDTPYELDAVERAAIAAGNAYAVTTYQHDDSLRIGPKRIELPPPLVSIPWPDEGRAWRLHLLRLPADKGNTQR